MQMGFLRLSKQSLLGYLVSLLVLSSVVGLFLFNPWNNSASAAWFNDAWGYRKAITLTVASSASDISNLDTLITIDTTGMTANLQTNCEDLRFTDVGGTILNYYIDSCNDNSSSNTVWVRVNTVPKNTTTYTLYMYYGNASAPAGSNATLFSLYNGLEAYWAMNESSWNTTAGEIKDNSANASHGTARGDATTTASGQFGRGALLDGGGDSFTTADNAEAELGSSDFTISTWVYMTTYPSTGFGAAIITKDDGAAAYAPYALVVRNSSNNIHSWMSSTGSSWDVMNDTNLGGSSALTLNAWHHVAFIRESGSCKLYIDTVVTSETSAGVSCSGTLLNTAAKPYFGGQFQSPNGNGIAGRMDDARIYKRALSPTDLTSLYTNPGNTSTNVNATIVPSTSFAAEEKGPSPIAYWKFDEGQGTTPQDSTSSNADGVLTGTPAPVWQTEDQCIASKCIYFGGSTSRATVATSLSGIQSVSFWVRPSSVSTVGLMDFDGGTRRLSVSSGTISAAGFTSPTIYVNGVVSSTIVANEWQYITVTTGTGFTGSAIKIGFDNTNYTTGFFDEVKMYSSALTAAQVAANYNARGNPDGISSVLGTNAQNNAGALSDGLVGYWKMDESADNSCSGGQDACDSSGNTNHGTDSGGSTVAAVGKFGTSRTLDGTDDYINAGSATGLDNLTSTAITAALWVKAGDTSTCRDIISKESGASDGWAYRINCGGAEHTIAIDAGSGDASTTVTAASPLSTSTWQHIAFTYDNNGDRKIRIYVDGVEQSYGTQTAATAALTDDSSRDLRIGWRGFGDEFSGSMDEVRVYKRALSPAEVSQLYNFAPGPVGYWKLDEGSWDGTSGEVKDSSGNGNNGVTVNSPTVTQGKFNKAGQFVRASSQRIDITNTAGVTNLAQGAGVTVMGWVNHATASNGVEHTLFNQAGGDGRGINLRAQNNGNGPIGEIDCVTTNASTSTTAAYSIGAWHHVAMVFDSSTGLVTNYVDGVNVSNSQTACVGGVVANSSNLRIGAHSNQWMNGKIDEVKLYNYPRSAKQIIEDMNGGHPAPGSPVGSALGHWKLDEGYGTTANNSGNAGSTLNGTFGGITQSTISGWTNAGKFAKAVNFDGTTASTDDRINIGSDSSVDDLTGTGKFMTVSGWIKPTTIGENSLGVIMAKNGNSSTPSNGWLFELAATSTIKFMVDYSSTDLNVVAANNSITLGEWQHVALTYDGSGLAANVHIYVNGKEVSYQTQTNSSGTIASDASNNLLIGNNNATGTSNTFDGTIDEVKLYTSALTADQVKLDMNKSQAQVLGATGDKTGTGYESKTSENQKYCIPGDSSTCTAPVGEWNLNEGTGTTANDSTGNGNTGTITAGTGGWVNGKSDGKAYNFDGADSVINAGSGTSLDDMTGISLEAWIYPRSVGEGSNGFIINKNLGNSQSSGWIIHYTSNQGLLFVVDGSTDLVRQTSNNVVPLNRWSHIAFSWGGTIGSASTARFFLNGVETSYQTTTNGASRASDAARSLYIGNASSSDRTFNGYMDQIRLYNYGRTPAQIAYSYNQGKPIAHWKLDECQGTTINDSSGNNFTGTLTNAASPGTCTSSGSWFNGVAGKRNYSMDFDGTDDYISMGSTTLGLGSGDVPYSISLWAKPSATRNDGCFFSYGGASSDQVISLCSDGSGNIYSVHYSNDFSYSTAWALNSWQHVVISYDPITSTESLYVNGQFKQSTTPSNLNLAPPATAYIGRASWNGVYAAATLIDDVRLFNYAVTASQVKSIYNDGAFRVGPATGAP